MAVKAYILIEVVAGKADAVVAAIRGRAGVTEASGITGPYDAIAIVEAADMDALGTLVKGQIQVVEGILRTMTCLAF